MDPGRQTGYRVIENTGVTIFSLILRRLRSSFQKQGLYLKSEKPGCDAELRLLTKFLIQQSHPSAAEAAFLWDIYGTAEAVPFQNNDFFHSEPGCDAELSSCFYYG
jgi:hypothetical protein